MVAGSILHVLHRLGPFFEEAQLKRNAYGGGLKQTSVFEILRLDKSKAMGTIRSNSHP
jgi:hypothetical protein